MRFGFGCSGDKVVVGKPYVQSPKKDLHSAKNFRALTKGFAQGMNVSVAVIVRGSVV